MDEQPKDIVARNIVIVDSNGKPRIQMHGEGPDGRCCIIMGDIRQGGISLECNPDSSHIWIHHGRGAKAGLTVGSEGICLTTEDGRLSLVLGRLLTGEDDLIILRDGQILWRNGAFQKASPSAAGPH